MYRNYKESKDKLQNEDQFLMKVYICGHVRIVVKETIVLTIHASMEAYVYTQMLYKCESIHLVYSLGNYKELDYQ